MGNSGFAMTLNPIVDVYHYAIMIDGIVYQVQGTKENKKEFWIDISTSPGVKYSFLWYVTAKSKCKNHKSKYELEEYAKEIERCRHYSVIPSDGSKTENCQSFVLKMLAYAAEITEDEAKWQIIRAAGNAFF